MRMLPLSDGRAEVAELLPQVERLPACLLYTSESTVEIAVQINGKTKATINIAKDADKDSVIAAAKEALGSLSLIHISGMI